MNPTIVLCCALAGALPAGKDPTMDDPRNIRTGLVIPSENYADQPYVVVTKRGEWLCTLTTGRGVEGKRGQHVVATISADRGRTWSKRIDIEPADGPEASWVMPLITPSGRIYAFYDYNGGNVTDRRADMLGWYCFRYSDDGGRSWSPKRYRLPVRLTDVDRTNTFAGKTQIFWGIGKPIVAGGSAIFAFTKIGRYMMDRSEGWFFRSANILTEPDAGKIVWEMLPRGEKGLRSPGGGSIQSEQNVVALSGGGLYCMYRTTTGRPYCAISRDGGATWTEPGPAVYSPGGRAFRHPRACPRIWRCANGKYLFWFHHHGGKDFRGRNPAWVSGGIETGGTIHWSQPELLLYDPDARIRISYPDLVEQDGRYWVTETQKTVARVHEIDASLLEGLWRQGEVKTVARKGLALSLGAAKIALGRAKMPRLGDLTASKGFAVELWLTPANASAGQVVLDSRGPGGQGLAVTTTPKGTLGLALSDGKGKTAWDCDEPLKAGVRHHVVFVVDAGARILSVVVDGLLCDGATRRQYGWGRLPKTLRDVTGGESLRVAPSWKGTLGRVRVYSRPLRTSEAVGNFHAGP